MSTFKSLVSDNSLDRSKSKLFQWYWIMFSHSFYVFVSNIILFLYSISSLKYHMNDKYTNDMCMQRLLSNITYFLIWYFIFATNTTLRLFKRKYVMSGVTCNIFFVCSWCFCFKYLKTTIYMYMYAHVLSWFDLFD